MKAIASAVLVAYFCSACFTYVPAPAVPQRAGEAVRVHLSQPQTVDLEEISAGNITRIDGEIAAVSNGEVVLSAFGLLSASGAEYSAQGRTVHLAREAIESVEQRRFDWLRSGAVVVAGVAAGLLFAAAGGEIFGGGRTRNPPSGGQ